MKKKLAYALSVGLIATASVVAASPAQAAVTATMSPTTDLYPGQTVSLTLVDDGQFCDAGIDGAPGGLWGAFADVIDEDSNVVGGVAFFSTEDYAGSGHTYDMEGSYSWLVDNSVAAEAGEYTTEGLYCDSIAGPSADVNANALAFSTKPMTVSASTVAAGGSVDVSVFDETGTWCLGEIGAGFSMGIGLFSETGEEIYVPAGITASSGVKGNGDFDWQGVSATATVIIPSDTPAGTYTLFAGCISSEADGYQQPGPGMLYQNFVVTAGKLADTGLSASTMGATGLAGLALLAAGAVVVIARRRSADAR